jgi:hypothetical protein
MKKSPTIEQNKQIAQAVEYNLESRWWNCEALEKSILFSSTNLEDPTAYEIKYTEPHFSEKLDKVLKDLKFGEPRWRTEV